jgi:hypothetical protein
MAAVNNRDVTAAMLPTDKEEIHGKGALSATAFRVEVCKLQFDFFIF